jgi:phosphate-selective porin OprO/OprP
MSRQHSGHERTVVRHLLTALLCGAAVLPMPAFAQDLVQLQAQLQAMQAEVARLSTQVAEMQAQQKATPAAPPLAVTAPAAAPAAAPPVTVAWKGAPEISGPNGFSFKPRGRLQVDAAIVDAPNTVAASNSLGFSPEVRRAFLGAEGTLPGGFGYRAEIDVANSGVEITDLFLTFKATPQLTLTLGQHKPFWGLEELTSDLFTSMIERAAFNSAFGFERRVGVSGTYSGKTVLVQLGAFTDNAADLNSDSNDSYSVDGRVVLAPKIGNGTLHIGASAHFREFNDASTTARYRARPFTHTTDVRLVDTRAFAATGERSEGGELAYINGPFHATLEGHRLTSLRPGLADPTFWGGYAEVGMLLTGDTTAYKGGVYDRIKPANPLGGKGIGAVQVNARYDKLDLTDGPIVGGQQDAAGLSIIWMPTDYVRFLANYGHLWISDAAVRAGADADYTVDTFGLRGQFDF